MDCGHLGGDEIKGLLVEGELEFVSEGKVKF